MRHLRCAREILDSVVMIVMEKVKFHWREFTIELFEFTMGSILLLVCLQ